MFYSRERDTGKEKGGRGKRRLEGSLNRLIKIIGIIVEKRAYDVLINQASFSFSLN